MDLSFLEQFFDFRGSLSPYQISVDARIALIRQSNDTEWEQQIFADILEKYNVFSTTAPIDVIS